MKIKKLFILLLVLPLVLSGCIVKVEDQKTSSDSSAGLFRSNNFGETWDRVTTLYTIGDKSLNFNASNITTIAFDALDEKAVYLGTLTDGVFYSYNYGDGWFNTLRGKGTINSIVIDPKENCNIFVAVHNTIYKSTDCSRKWETVYFEAREKQFINTLAIDANDPRIIYAGTSGGSFLKSQDYGESWDVIHRFEDSLKEIIVQNNYDSNVLYLATLKSGVYRSSDAGANWVDLMDFKVDKDSIDEEAEFIKKVEERKKQLRLNPAEDLPEKEYNKLADNKYPIFKKLGKDAGLYSVLNTDKSVKDGVIFANKLGVFRLTKPEDGIWEFLDLLTPQASDNIFSAAVNSEDTKDIIYGTTNALYRSKDGGVNWSIKKLPTNSVAKVLEFSPDNKFLYLGAYTVKKK